MRLPLFFCLLTIALCRGGELLKLDRLETVDGKSYVEVVITEKLPDGIKILHRNGAARLKAEQLPADLVKQLGGFDKGALEAFRNAEEKDRETRVEQELKAQEAQQQEATMWEPYTTAIDKLRQNIPVGQEAKFQQLKDDLAALQTICRPLLSAHRTTPAEVSQWCQLVNQHQICKGMPADMVRMSWGQPPEERLDSDGVRHWTWPVAHVTVDSDGFVDFWVMENRTAAGNE